MTYQMSWERTRNVWDEFDTDTDTITDENDNLDEDLFIPTPNFDPLEILQGKMSDPYVILRVSTNRKKETMSVNGNTYQVGDLFTTQKSAVTGTIKEIIPVNANVTRVLLDVDGQERYTTVTL